LLLWRCAPTRAMASSFTTFQDHTQRHTPEGWTPLSPTHRTPPDDTVQSVGPPSPRRTEHHLTHNTYNRQTSLP